MRISFSVYVLVDQGRGELPREGGPTKFDDYTSHRLIILDHLRPAESLDDHVRLFEAAHDYLSRLYNHGLVISMLRRIDGWRFGGSE